MIIVESFELPAQRAKDTTFCRFVGPLRWISPLFQTSLLFKQVSYFKQVLGRIAAPHLARYRRRSAPADTAFFAFEDPAMSPAEYWPLALARADAAAKGLLPSSVRPGIGFSTLAPNVAARPMQAKADILALSGALEARPFTATTVSPSLRIADPQSRFSKAHLQCAPLIVTSDVYAQNV